MDGTKSAKFVAKMCSRSKIPLFVLMWATAHIAAAQPELALAAPLDAQPVLTVLHQAARRGDTAAIEQRLDAGDAVDVRDERNMTPLHHCCQYLSLN